MKTNIYTVFSNEEILRKHAIMDTVYSNITKSKLCSQYELALLDKIRSVRRHIRENTDLYFGLSITKRYVTNMLEIIKYFLENVTPYGKNHEYGYMFLEKLENWEKVL